MLYGTSNLPNGTSLFLEDSAPGLGYVWDTPDASDSPILGGTNGRNAVDWIVGADPIPTELWIGATVGSTTVGALALTLTAPATSTAPSTQATTLIQISMNLNSGDNGIASGTVVSGNSANPTSWLVGQEVDLLANMIAPPQITGTTFSWLVSASYGADYKYEPSGNASTLLNVADGQALVSAGNLLDAPNQELKFFWVSVGGPGQTQNNQVQLTANVNGQRESVMTTFAVTEPNAAATAYQGLAQYGPALPNGAPEEIGLWGQPFGMVFQGSVHTSAGFNDGIWAFSQLWSVNRHRTVSGVATHYLNSGNGLGLDNGFPYSENPDDLYSSPTTPGWTVSSGTHSDRDSPFFAIGGDDTADSIADSFETFLMYRPPGAGSQWVPLLSISWNFNISITRANVNAPWTIASASQGINGQAVAIADFGPATSEPDWDFVNHNNIPFLRG